MDLTNLKSSVLRAFIQDLSRADHRISISAPKLVALLKEKNMILPNGQLKAQLLEMVLEEIPNLIVALKSSKPEIIGMGGYYLREAKHFKEDVLAYFGYLRQPA